MTDPGRSSYSQAISTIAQEFGDYFRYLSDLGCNGFACEQESTEIIKSWGKKRVIPPETLETIQKDLNNCTQCGLSGTRSRTVFGKGNPEARLVFVGDWPGPLEETKGEPFLGEAGQLLTKIIEAINQTRESVYLMNIVKCPPPDGKTPQHSEVKACHTFLKRQIRVINPDFICTLGPFASQALLDTQLPVSKLRGRFHNFMGIKLMATYHPALLLKEPEKKRAVWEDMKSLMAVF